MPVSTLHEIRILPGLAISRLGSSSSPMDNYNAIVDGADFRRLEPAETLIVDPQAGEITGAVTPASVRFRDAQNRIRPVCPFLELWGRFDDEEELRPVVKQDLLDLSLSPEDVQWSVGIGNLKIFRRTGDPNDRITAEREFEELRSHQHVELEGKCANFKSDTAKITMGWIQYVRPTDDFPEIRVRFTPPHGLVYGHREVPGIIPPERAVYDSLKGRWDTHEDQSPQPNNATPRARLFTIPGGIYARTPDTVGNLVQLGYFDDVGDAILQASLPGLSPSVARISVGPPDFAPDSYSTRTVEDELQQMVHGITPNSSIRVDEVIDIVRRAVETMRLMNTEYGNSNFMFWVSDLLPVFNNPASVNHAVAKARHEGILVALEGLKKPADHPDRVGAHAALKTVANILRDFNRAADYDSDNMKRMPAMMRDASSQMLTLTRRQINTLRMAVEQFKPSSSGSNDPVVEMHTMITSFVWAAALHTNISTQQDGNLDAIFDDPDKVLAHLTAGVAQGNDAVVLGIQGDPLVVNGKPDDSAIVKLVNKSDHAMYAQFTNYRTPNGNSNGVDILRSWIESLS